MPVDGAPDEELRESLAHLVTESRKADRHLTEAWDDARQREVYMTRIGRLHDQMADLVDELLERRRHVTLGTV